ncbi:recombinase RecT [Clostridium sp. JN-1]|uniref:recombinase RecT n=1 Tax=Clostridium sp. JN-1 TaxID=2483110 RepID=UPI000F0BBDC3|nr:recombinase RecT [Clostridium sp. JN-1]
MATSKSLKNELAKKEKEKLPKDPFKALVYSAGIKKRFEDMLDKQADGFITSLLNLKQDKLKKCDNMTVLGSALKAASLKLPIDPNLGFAWIIPFKNHGKLEAQFQIGYRGFIQMAQRSGQYKKLNVTEIYEGQLKSFNPLTEEIELDLDNKQSDAVIGYAAYFRLLNGFEKMVYWSKEKVTSHAKRFSKSFGNGPWKTDFDAMARKTVLKNMLSTWGILSIDMQEAVISDNKIIKTDEENYELLEEGTEDPQGVEATDVEYTEAGEDTNSSDDGKDPYEGTPFSENTKS